MTCLRSLLMVAFLLANLANLFGEPADSNKLSEISVVMDDNYPPYVFRDDDGTLKGVLFDYWQLWQQKTGIKVNIHAMNWGQALAMMEHGSFDVIDTIFRNPKREQLYSFTPPYAKLDVPIFFHRDISGIAGIQDISGYVVGVKEGDNVIDVIMEQSQARLQLFSSYEAIVQAAAAGSIKMFSIDRPPALYLMQKYGLLDDFKETRPMYYGEFHRAVKKERPELLTIIMKGFEAISAAEYQQIEEKWFGKALFLPFPIEHALTIMAVIIGIVLLLFFWVYSLKKTVSARTQQLTEAKNQITAIYDSVNDGIVVHNSDGTILDVNQQFCAMYQYKKEELLSLNIGQLSHEAAGFTQEEAIYMLEQARVNGPQLFEWEGLRKDGSVFPIEVSTRLALIGKNHWFLVSVRDISERKSDKDKLQQSLQDRETLLHELYHRTKNNMQVICSLLHLESTKISDPTTRTVFLEMENRILSMSLVHQKLYGSKNLSELNLREYIEELLDLLLRTNPRDNKSIQIVTELADIHVVIDAAIPCGLILNELISNTFKHAFPGQQPGTIHIGLQHSSPDTIELVFKDNGVGLPPGFVPEQSDGLGLKIIYSIGKQQLGGKINMSSDAGLHFALTFRNDIFNKRV